MARWERWYAHQPQHKLPVYAHHDVLLEVVCVALERGNYKGVALYGRPQATRPSLIHWVGIPMLRYLCRFFLVPIICIIEPLKLSMMQNGIFLIFY
jgi:hypothetical protein